MRSEEVELLQQTEHDMLAAPNAAERSRQDFVRSFKTVLQSEVGPGVETTYQARIAPRWTKQHGAPPANRHEIRKAMVVDPYFQTFASLTRVSQELLWDTVIDSVERQLPELMEKAAANGDKNLGSLTLDPNLKLPKYVTGVDIHCMPGGYTHESRPNDLAVGALYDRGVFIYSKGMTGPLNDDIGRSTCNYLRRRFPDFKPRRILDLGCTVGHSTLPYVDTFPDAEVYAVDVGAPCLRYAHARAEALGKPVHFSQQNAEHTNFPDGHFDLIVSHILFHETSGKALPAIMKETYRLLAPGGKAAHADLPSFDNLEGYDQFILDCETYYNNEPFWGAMLERDQIEDIVKAGFEREQVSLEFAPVALFEAEARSFRAGEFGPPGTGWQVLIAGKAAEGSEPND
jgi:ubiquinone/menaquinone biosynthesis C-methylase UbiE